MRLAQGHRASQGLEPRPRGSLSSSVPPVPIARAGVREPGTSSETEVTRLRIRTDTSALDLLGERGCIISPSDASVSLMRLLPPFFLQSCRPRHSRPQESNLLCATHARERGTRTERTCLRKFSVEWAGEAINNAAPTEMARIARESEVPVQRELERRGRTSGEVGLCPLQREVASYGEAAVRRAAS